MKQNAAPWPGALDPARDELGKKKASLAIWNIQKLVASRAPADFYESNQETFEKVGWHKLPGLPEFGPPKAPMPRPGQITSGRVKVKVVLVTRGGKTGTGATVTNEYSIRRQPRGSSLYRMRPRLSSELTLEITKFDHGVWPSNRTGCVSKNGFKEWICFKEWIQRFKDMEVQHMVQEMDSKTRF